MITLAVDFDLSVELRTATGIVQLPSHVHPTRLDPNGIMHDLVHNRIGVNTPYYMQNRSQLIATTPDFLMKPQPREAGASYALIFIATTALSSRYSSWQLGTH